MTAVRLRGLTKSFNRNGPPVLEDIHLIVPKGRLFAVLGESGAGKTTLARIIAGLLTFDSGDVEVMGHGLRPGRLPRKAFYRDVQYLFQHAALSFNPGFQTIQAVKEPMYIQHTVKRTERMLRARELMDEVGLGKFTHARSRDLSGGQVQRLALARALAMGAGLVIADEVTAGLDTRLKLEVMDLLVRYAKDGLSVVFITHELRLAREFADACAVLYKGRVVETGPAARVLNEPAHPYTRLLMDASLDLDDPKRPIPEYEPGLESSRGCAFLPNCPVGGSECSGIPPWTDMPTGVRVRCFHPYLDKA